MVGAKKVAHAKKTTAIRFGISSKKFKKAEINEQKTAT
jgi:hypothetical protein